MIISYFKSSILTAFSSATSTDVVYVSGNSLAMSAKKLCFNAWHICSRKSVGMAVRFTLYSMEVGEMFKARSKAAFEIDLFSMCSPINMPAFKGFSMIDIH